MSGARSRSARFLIIVALAFMVGLVPVLLQGDGAASVDPTPDSANRRTILILGVDSLLAENPRLVAVWEASFRLQEREVFVLGWPVDMTVCAPEPRPLNQLFRWTEAGGISPAFMAAFDGQELFTPQVIIVADEVAFSWLIDWRQGVELGEAALNGQQAVAVLRPLYDNPAGMLAIQEGFVNSLKDRVPSLGETLPLDDIPALIPDHLYMSHSISDLLSFLSPLIPLDTTPIFAFKLTPAEPDCPGG